LEKKLLVVIHTFTLKEPTIALVRMNAGLRIFDRLVDVDSVTGMPLAT
jgi:hypothetical protein